MKTYLAAAALLLAPMTAHAQAGLAGWTGEASLTGNRTTGNTDTTDIGLGLKLARQGDIWRHEFQGSADFGRANGATNRERYLAGYQLERDIGDRLFAFGKGDLFFDDFGAFREGWFLGGGLGFDVLESSPTTWSVTGGAGYRSQTSAAGVTNEEFALDAGSDFDWQINDNVSLYDDAGILWSESNTYLFNEIGLTADLMGNLAARASFRIDHNTDVPLGREKTDTITRFGIVYTID
ncbi:MAG: DUF481 domain-containing protein [Litorimonas sp.]